MSIEIVIFKDLGLLPYREAWDYQEALLQANVKCKSDAMNLARASDFSGEGDDHEQDRFPAANDNLQTVNDMPETTNYLLFVEHPPVYTLGKSGSMDNVLLNDQQLAEKNIDFFHTNRGGDITYHGPGQIVGYPILDLEKFGTDIGKYLRRIEETIILTLEEYGIKGERSAGETGVWLDPGEFSKARKICAIGVRCSRWITMHGFALNVNTDLSYFNHIIPCGIQDKKVTSLQEECGHEMDINEVKKKLKTNFEKVFSAKLK